MRVRQAGIAGRWLPVAGLMMAALLASGAGPAPSAAPAETGGKAAAPATKPAQVPEAKLKEATALLGQDVYTPDNQRIGRIIDVLVDAKGKPRAVVVDFGGFMGIGSRKVAVAWDKMHFPKDDGKDQRITTDLTPKQIAAAPAYQEGKAPVPVTGAPARTTASPAPAKPTASGTKQP